MRRFTLVYVLYSTAIATPGHGSLSPLALGLTYYVIVATGVPLRQPACCTRPSQYQSSSRLQLWPPQSP